MKAARNISKNNSKRVVERARGMWSVASQTIRETNEERSEEMYYIINEHGLHEEVSLHVWAKWFETNKRIIATDTICQTFVSTVFLGMDHRYGPREGKLPLLYETMTFSNGCLAYREIQDRYTTKEEALDGHARMVKRVKIHYIKKHLIVALILVGIGLLLKVFV